MIDGLMVREAIPPLPSSMKTPILMVHGVCHGWWAFEKWIKFFAVFGWPSLAMSLRNHEGSYRMTMEEFLCVTLDDYVQDVLKVLKWLSKPAVLLGHSMGGIIAQKVAEQLRLRALVLVASVGPGQLGPIRAPLPLDRPFKPSLEEARALWFRSIGEEELAEIYSKLSPESPSAMNQYGTGQVRINRQKISCPVLVVGAQYDQTVVHPFQRIAEFYGCESLLVPNAGHDLMLEPVALDSAIAINRWLLGVLPEEGLQIVSIQTPP